MYRAAERSGEHSPEFIKMLIRAGANIEGDRCYMDPPLIGIFDDMWKKSSAKENIQILLNAGTNVNHQDRDGRTPLHFLLNDLVYMSFEGSRILNKYLGCIDMLLAAGANRWTKNRKGQTPMQFAKEGQFGINNTWKNKMDFPTVVKAVEKLEKYLEQ